MVVRGLRESVVWVRFPALRKSMYQVYILQSFKDQRTYVGYSKDIGIRIKKHNLGKVNATRNRRPLKIIYLEKAQNLKEAKYKEKYWKSGGGRKKLSYYFKYGFPPIIFNDRRGSPR